MINLLLEQSQLSFPVCENPFRVLGEKVGLSEDEAINEFIRLKNEGVIRQTSAILEAKRLGYASSLVAFKVSDQDIEKTVELINSHPGVSHNYLRSDAYNVWFTIMTEPDSLLGLEKTVELIAKLSGCTDYLILPTLKLFKIGVHLKASADPLAQKEVKKREIKELVLTDQHKKALDLLQNDIELISNPFEKIIKTLDIDYKQLETLFDELKKAGLIRRFATILNHKKAGFSANAMSVWRVDDDKIEEIGQKVASFEAVSHCYKRTVYPSWNYNLYAMIHGKSHEETNALISHIQKEFDIKEFKVLYSTKEFKKVRVHYFSNSFKEWEEKFNK